MDCTMPQRCVGETSKKRLQNMSWTHTYRLLCYGLFLTPIQNYLYLLQHWLIATVQSFPVTLHEDILSYLSLHKSTSIWKDFSNFCEYICRWRGGAWGRTSVCVSDRPVQPIEFRSASASLPSGAGRGRAGRLPKRGVRVGVNGWRREAGASMSGTGALDQHSWAGIGHTAGSGLHSSTKQDCEKRGK